MKTVTNKLKQAFKYEKINRSYQLLWWGRLVSQLGDKLYLLALPWLVLEITHSALYSSITLALEVIPQIIFSPFIGVLVDHYSRKRLMVISDWIRGFAVGGITVLALIDQVEMSYIYIAAIILSIFTLIFDSASQGFLSTVVKKEELVSANASLTFVNTVMRLIGPVISGIAIGIFGAAGTIGINAISFFLSGIILAFLANDQKSNTKLEINHIFANIREGFQYLISHSILFPIAVFSTFMNIGITLVSTLFIFESKESLGYSSEQTAIIFWVSGISSVLTTLMIKHLNIFKNKRKMVQYGSLGVFLSTLILLIDQNLITFTISYSLILAVGIIVNVNMMAYRQEIVPNHLFGRVMTSNKVLVSSFTPIAMILSGWLATRYGTLVVFQLAAIIIFLNVLYAWFGKLKRL